MKKAVLLILALMLTVSLAACGGGKSGNNNSGGDAPLGRDPGTSSNTPSNTPDNSTPAAPDFDMGAILSGNGGSALIGSMDEATKQELIKQANEDGYDLTFGADGSAKLTDRETGDVLVQKPDGSWSLELADGEGSVDVNFDGKWPDNEFTKLIPKPEFDIGTTVDSPNAIIITAIATIEQTKAYTEQCKGKGFTKNDETEDVAMAGMVIYAYTAENDAGYALSISFTSGSVTIMVEKP